MKRTVTAFLTLLMFTATVVALPAAASATSAPNLIRADNNGAHNSVAWAPLPGDVKGVNVYRNGNYLTSVASPGTVYSDFDGSPLDAYYVVAFDHSNPPNFSAKSEQIWATSTELQPVKNFRARDMGNGSTKLLWTHGDGDRVEHFTIYRNGQLWKVVHSSPWGMEWVIDTNSASNEVVYYQVFPSSRNHEGTLVLGPKSLVMSPILLAGKQSFQSTTVTGSNTYSNAHAAAANASAAEARTERAEANSAVDHFSVAAVVAALAPNPATLATATGLGMKAYKELGDAQAAEKVAKEMMERYESCMQSACGRVTTPGDGTPNIPGTNTPGGCNTGGCWPA